MNLVAKTCVPTKLFSIRLHFNTCYPSLRFLPSPLLIGDVGTNITMALLEQIDIGSQLSIPQYHNKVTPIHLQQLLQPFQPTKDTRKRL